jgi:hypothetical protein
VERLVVVGHTIFANAHTPTQVKRQLLRLPLWSKSNRRRQAKDIVQISLARTLAKSSPQRTTVFRQPSSRSPTRNCAHTTRNERATNSYKRKFHPSSYAGCLLGRRGVTEEGPIGTHVLKLLESRPIPWMPSGARDAWVGHNIKPAQLNPHAADVFLNLY